MTQTPMEGAIMGGDITANPDGLPTIDGIPINRLLGLMIGYTIQSCRVPVNDFQKKARELGLPEIYVPQEPKKMDAFKKAIKIIQTTHTGFIDESECRIEYKVDAPHGTTWDTISMRIFGKKEGSTKFGNLVRQQTLFNIGLNEKDEIAIEPYSDNVDEPILMVDMYNEIYNEYLSLLTHFDGSSVRRAIRKFIFSNNGIPYTVANGGTFFLPIEALDLATKWEHLIDWVRQGDYAMQLRRYNGAGSRFIIKALLDTKKERLYVLEDVQQELANAYRTWLKDLLHQLKSKDDEDFIEELIRKKLVQKGDITFDLANRYKKLLGKEINFELHGDILDDVKNFTFKNKQGKWVKPSGRLQGLFEELVIFGN